MEWKTSSNDVILSPNRDENLRWTRFRGSEMDTLQRILEH